ncbi:hypothetical protein M569_14267, partial [Genlisea aurea]
RQITARRSPATPASILQSLKDQASNSGGQVIGLAALAISGGILLLLAGLTVTAAVLGMIFFAPLILISSPLWVPAAIVSFVVAAGGLAAIVFATAAAVSGAWVYSYFMGLNPPGWTRVDYARNRIADTAGHVKDRYWTVRVKDAAPGA